MFDVGCDYFSFYKSFRGLDIYSDISKKPVSWDLQTVFIYCPLELKASDVEFG